jgi:muconolactone delta-isomerase
VSSVAGFLIPIRDYSLRTLAAVQYALELHKRTGTRQHFLFIKDPIEGLPPRKFHNQNEEDQVRQTIEEILAREMRNNGDLLDLQHRTGDYFEVLCDVAKNKHVDEIIVSLPAADDPTYQRVTQEISMLIQMTHCRVLTINPKKGS